MFLRYIWSTTEPHKHGVIIGGEKCYVVRRPDGRRFFIFRAEATTLNPGFRKAMRCKPDPNQPSNP